MLKSEAKVFEDPRYAEIRHLFRQSPEGVETVMQDMVARSPLRQWSLPVKASPERRARN